MSLITLAAVRRCMVLLIASSLAANTFAADNAPRSPMSAQLVKTGLYVIEGGGANTLMRFTAAGLIIIDGKSAGMYRGVMSHIRRLNKFGDLPVRVLVLTSADDAKTGNLAAFTAAGVPIVAHDNTKRALDQKPMEDTPRYVTFTDQYSIKMGGVEAQAMHFAGAGGDGATVVYFPNLKVVALGDLYATTDPTDGNLADWSAALGEIMRLDFDTAVPAHGPSVTRAEVAAFKARLDGLAKVTSLQSK